MKIYKTCLAISGGPSDKGAIFTVDTIKHKGKMWIVPEWLDKPGEGWSMPARLICLDTLPHQKTPGGPGDFLLNDPIPKSVCEGQIPPQSEYEYVVIESPKIKVPRTH